MKRVLLLIVVCFLFLNNGGCEHDEPLLKKGKIKQIVLNKDSNIKSGSFFLFFGIGGGSVGEKRGKEYYSGYFYINEKEIKYLKFPIEKCSFIEDDKQEYEYYYTKSVGCDKSVHDECGYLNCSIKKVIFHIPKNSILYNIDINLKRGNK